LGRNQVLPGRTARARAGHDVVNSARAMRGISLERQGRAHVFITANGERHELTQPLTVTERLAVWPSTPGGSPSSTIWRSSGARLLQTRPFVKATGSK
jgi:hypothetical protein